MSFKTWNPEHLARFNSSTSSDFLDTYESYVDMQIKQHAEEPAHRTFSGSSFRCDRRSWFRLRGTEPDTIVVPDKTLNFSAEIGTACHRLIQSNLINILGDDWLSVQDYMDSHNLPYEYTVEHDDGDLESQVHVFNPPIRFAVDGLLRWKNKIYLLEIKTSEFNSWNELTAPKPQHIDQVQCYASLLDIHDVLFLYQDRQYGSFKCFEVKVTDYEMQKIKNRFAYVMEMVEKNLSPDPLPKNDPWCTSSSMCPYYHKCQEYGRF